MSFIYITIFALGTCWWCVFELSTKLFFVIPRLIVIDLHDTQRRTQMVFNAHDSVSVIVIVVTEPTLPVALSYPILVFVTDKSSEYKS